VNLTVMLIVLFLQALVHQQSVQLEARLQPPSVPGAAAALDVLQPLGAATLASADEAAEPVYENVTPEVSLDPPLDFTYTPEEIRQLRLRHLDPQVGNCGVVSGVKLVVTVRHSFSYCRLWSQLPVRSWWLRWLLQLQCPALALGLSMNSMGLSV
jgi:hypothetical protein